MSETVKTSEKFEQKSKVRCPKGMKLPTWVKRMASSIPTKAGRREFMRSMGIAMHEAAYKIKSANKASAVRTSAPVSVTENKKVEA